MNDFSIYIISDSGINQNIISCIQSLQFGHGMNITLILNGYSKNQDKLLSYPDLRSIDVVKYVERRPINKIKNKLIMNCSTKYIVFLEDDVTVRRENIFDIIRAKHSEGFPELILSDKRSAVSQDLSEWLPSHDESFVGIGFENLDRDLTLRQNICGDIYKGVFTFDPYLFSHYRVEGHMDPTLVEKNLSILLNKWGDPEQDISTKSPVQSLFLLSKNDFKMNEMGSGNGL